MSIVIVYNPYGLVEHYTQSPLGGMDFLPLTVFIRPLQINSLFPVHRPHLVTVSSKYSILPYSSIVSRLFLHTGRLNKAHVSAVLSSQHKLHVCVIFAI